MSNRLEGKVLVAQGGGPTPVINQSIVGVALEARKFSQVTSIYGAVHGVSGIINEEFVDLTRETTHNLEQVAGTPSSGLLSTRDKPDEEYCARMFEVMKAHDIRYFFYVGGNDSSDTVRIVNEQAEAEGYELRAIHIPKTIDNDLMENDHCPGFGSAARFVAQAFMGVNLDNRALRGVYIGCVMGRHAGFLTASSALAQKYFDDGPHLVYVPERHFNTEQLLADVDRVYSKHGLCTIAVSEGISDQDGTPMIVKLLGKEERDSHGNVQLSGTGALGDLLADTIRDGLKIKRVRSDTFGYLQRSFMGIQSDRDATRGPRGRREGRPVRHVGQRRWLGRDQAPGARLLGGLRAGGHHKRSPGKPATCRTTLSTKQATASPRSFSTTAARCLAPIFPSHTASAHRKCRKFSTCRNAFAKESPVQSGGFFYFLAGV